MLPRFLAAALLTAAVAIPHAPAPGDLPSTLAKLDAASKTFTSAEAKVHRDSWNALIKDIDDRQDGTLYVIRNKDGKSQMGMKTEGQGARTVEYKNGIVRDYIPGTNCFNTVNKPGIDTYLSLGFGGSGKDLAANWNITDQGPDPTLKAEKLDLVPKDSAVKSNVTHVAIWIDLDQDVTRKLTFYSPSGDTNTATYSDIRLNKSINTAAYTIKGKPCS
jgi:hypothetical protein